MEFVREHFDVPGPAQRLMENILDYAENLPEEEQYPVLSELLSGAIGLLEDEIRQIRLW